MTGPWVGAEMLHQGAEAIVYAGTWMDRDAILKQRQPRKWRHPDLDARLTKSRMSAEVRLLRRLHLSGLPVPELLAIDAPAGWVITSRMPGIPLFEHLRGGGGSEMLEELGATIRQIHAAGISHGDLTTHNILWDDDAGLSIIVRYPQSQWRPAILFKLAVICAPFIDRLVPSKRIVSWSIR